MLLDGTVSEAVGVWKTRREDWCNVGDWCKAIMWLGEATATFEWKLEDWVSPTLNRQTDRQRHRQTHAETNGIATDLLHQDQRLAIHHHLQKGASAMSPP